MLAQAALAGACLYAYTRLRHSQDSAGQERIAWGIKVEAAVSQADSAMKKAEVIETAHFVKLKALFEAQSLELSDAKARIQVLERELKVCQMKLANEERINRRDEQRKRKLEAAEDGDQVEPANGKEPADLDEAIRMHGIPLGGAGAAAAVPPQRSRPFGKPL